MVKLTLEDKLDFLWNDFLKFVKNGVSTGKYPKEISQNFKKITKKFVKGFSEDALKYPRCGSCKNNCCAHISGKIPLTLLDVARLIDNGYQSDIQGNFKGFSILLDKYLDTKDETVFNEINVLLFYGLNNEYVPFLKKIGSRCVFFDEYKGCKIQKIKPMACRRSPYQINFETKFVEFKDPCGYCKTEITEEEKDEIIKEIVESENQRTRDLSLMMLNKENLKKIGFAEYL